MDRVTLEKRFGPRADYYERFINMSNDELRIVVADLVAHQGQMVHDEETKKIQLQRAKETKKVSDFDVAAMEGGLI